MNRLPIRWRLTLGFAGAMAVLLAVAGTVLHLLLARSLDAEIRRELIARSDEVIALATATDRALPPVLGGVVADSGEGLAQIVDPATGRVLESTAGATATSALTPAEIAGAGTAPRVIGRRRLANGVDVRLAVRTFAVAGTRRVLVVGDSLRRRDATLRRLDALIIIGAPMALLLASLAGAMLARGALRPVEAMRRRAERISGERGGQRLPVGPSRDEVQRLGLTLNAMLERLDAAMARERTFVSDASHELRTPLAILKGELELAQRPDRTVAELRAAIASGAEETDRLVQLAEDLLVTARMDQGQLPVRLTTLDVRELLNDVRVRFLQRAADAGRAIALDVPDDAPAIHADPLRLEQALGNLMANALRHGGGNITLAAVTTPGMIALHVRDQGGGLPASFVPRAFERFSRLDGARARGGTGLGLAIVDAIARAHGGRAGAAAGPGGDVWIELPLRGRGRTTAPGGDYTRSPEPTGDAMKGEINGTT